MSDTNWISLLNDEDVEGLWNGLYQMVSRHPAVRPLHFATDGAAVTSQTEINADLTQELFLELFQKQRFDHYLNNGYSNTDVENELAYIELPNLVGERLRRRYPESFRMARRVSALLKTSSRFRRFGESADGDSEKPARRRGRPPKSAKPKNEQPAYQEDDYLGSIDDADEEQTNPRAQKKRRRAAHQVFGLREWKASKPFQDPGHFEDKIKSVAVRTRDTRIVGRSGSSQVILSNPELEALIVEVFRAIDSPANVRTVRQLVLSKIPLQDYNVASLDEELRTGNNGATIKREATDTRETPEDFLLREERHNHVSQLVGGFLKSLRHAVNNNERRYSRLISTLWHCYYDPDEPSQLEIAERLGVSDSLVSDNRRLIEHELKKLSLSVDEGAIFSEALQRSITNNESLMKCGSS